MLGKLKGSSTGMPVLAIVGVVASLAGLGVIMGLVGNISTQTGQDHDRRQLVDLGASIENKCTDVSGGTSTVSPTAISIDLELKSDVELETDNTTDPGYEITRELILNFAGQSNEGYDLPSDTCDIFVRGLPVGAGQYSASVSHNPDAGPSKAQGDDGRPNILVTVE